MCPNCSGTQFLFRYTQLTHKQALINDQFRREQQLRQEIFTGLELLAPILHAKLNGLESLTDIRQQASGQEYDRQTG
jgi:hypothetical protein